MLDSDVPNLGKRRVRPVHLLAVAIGLVGLVMMHEPMIVSGLGRIQTDLGDSRLINYFLEHNYLWYLGAKGHESFWDPPFFYPARNIAAYSDTMLGIAPLYAMFRAVGFAPDTAFQLWMIALSALNYTVMLRLLTRRIGLSVAASSAGAFLFAFGSPRLNMLAQQTQLTQFLSLISLDALFGLFTSGMIVSRPARAAAWLVAAAGMLAQLSSGFYPGWFMVFSLGITSIVALWMPSSRRPFLSTLVRDAPWIALAAGLAALAIRPWLAHHLAAARELGPRWFQWVWKAMPRPTSWLDTGPGNWLGVWASSQAGIRGFRSDEHSIGLGIGLVTTAAVLAGLYSGRRRVSMRLLTASACLLAICLTRWPDDLAVIAKLALVLVPLSFAYAGRREHPGVLLAVLGLNLGVLFVKGFTYNDFGQGCSVFALLIAAAAIVGRSGDRREIGVLAASILGFTWFLFPSPTILADAAICGGLLGVAGFFVGGRSRVWVEAAMLFGFLGFAVAISFVERPTVLLIAVCAPIAMLLAHRATVKPPARSLPHIALIGAAAEIVFANSGAGWIFFYIHVPGASSMIFVSRVGLILLIPASLGLALAIDALLSRKKTAVAVALGLICLVEQGGTTPSFDKRANRQAIELVARRIDPRPEAFYYTPDEAMAPVQANLDAMWASLIRSRPTINGYSGHTPRAWRDLDEPNSFGPLELRKLAPALDLWKGTVGRSVSGVQWIAPADLAKRGREGATEP